MNSAAALVQLGYRVLAIDFDLEAPGLDSYAAAYDPHYAETQLGDTGVLWLMMNLASVTSSDDRVDLYRRHIRHTLLPTGESLDLMPAGSGSPAYAELLPTFDWECFFTDHDGGAKLEEWRAFLRTEYDYVLIDSRTGLTDIGGICTVQLPDVIVAVYGSSFQSIAGTAGVLDRIQARRDSFGVDRAPATIIPLLGKSDARSEFREARRWSSVAYEYLVGATQDWLSAGETAKRVFEHLKVPYVTYFSFGERLAVLDESSADPDTPGPAYALVAQLMINGPKADLIIGERSWRSVRPSRANTTASRHPSVF